MAWASRGENHSINKTVSGLDPVAGTPWIPTGVLALDLVPLGADGLFLMAFHDEGADACSSQCEEDNEVHGALFYYCAAADKYFPVTSEICITAPVDVPAFGALGWDGAAYAAGAAGLVGFNTTGKDVTAGSDLWIGIL